MLAPKPACNYPEAAPCYQQVIGSLESIDSAAIVVRRENSQSVTVLRRPGMRLDLSTGPGACGGGRRANCIVIGALCGAFLGVAAVIVAGQLAPIEASTGLAVTVPGGAVVGTIIGAVVGGGEHWERADLPAHLSVGPDGFGRFALALSVRF